MDVDALREAIAEDVRLGSRPIAIVATTGTTSTTSIDPVAADRRPPRRGGRRQLGTPIWLHVDGAYGGVAAICDELRWVLDGVDRADSFVTNPHKWLFTPIDCSALLRAGRRRADAGVLAGARSTSPPTTRASPTTWTGASSSGAGSGRSSCGPCIRYFGRDGLAARIRHHVAQAQRVVAWVEAHPHLELAAPAPALDGLLPLGRSTGEDEDAATDRNRAWLAAINATGEAYLSHTVLDGRYVLRLATGNLRTTDDRLDATLATLDRELTPLLP